MRRVYMMAAVAALIALIDVARPVAAAAAGGPGEGYQIDWHHGLRLKMSDGVVLNADAGVPKPSKEGQLFPVIIAMNSWGVPEFEYILKELQWAQDGYIMVEYETRGWYLSGGIIDVAGPQDQKDVSTVIDYVLAQKDWNADPTRIATIGVSYGAGLSVMAAAQDPRIKTAVSMSGWGNIEESLWDHQSPAQIWSALLVIVGKLVGREPPVLLQMFEDLLEHRNISMVEAWAAQRSPATFVDQLNARRVPIFMSNNMEDRLFKPQVSLAFWQQLTGPKFMLLNQGIHATSEVGGLFDIPHNFVWGKAKLWLDHYLKDLPTGITEEPQVQYQLRNDFNVRVTFNSWPDATVRPTKFALDARGGHLWGGLVDEGDATASGKDTLMFSRDSGLKTGLPVVGELFQVFADVPILAELLTVSRSSGLVYTTEPLKGTVRLCGSPNATVTVVANDARWQLVAYLYKVDALGIGTLLSHGPYTQWEGKVGVEQKATFNLRTLCEDVDKGYRLAFGLDMYSPLYEPANSSSKVELNIMYGADTFLSLPINAV